AELYLRAKQAARMGDLEPLKIFYQKRLALPWRDFVDDFRLEIEPSGYRLGESWESEAALDAKGRILEAPFAPEEAAAPMRILTVDCQMDHLFAVARGWAADGSSRLLWHERLLTWDDVDELQERFGIHSNLVF